MNDRREKIRFDLLGLVARFKCAADDDELREMVRSLAAQGLAKPVTLEGNGLSLYGIDAAATQQDVAVAARHWIRRAERKIAEISEQIELNPMVETEVVDPAFLARPENMPVMIEGVRSLLRARDPAAFSDFALEQVLFPALDALEAKHGGKTQ